MNQESNRIVFADVLRSLAILFVVLIHVTAPILYRFNSIRPDWWWISNLIDSSSRWCVPVFFMISGLLLLNPKKEESIYNFFNKRVKKIVIPFICWSIIYFFLESGKQLIYTPLNIIVVKFITGFIEGNIYYTFWFFYTIIGLYIITPILRVLVTKSSNLILKYLILLWIIANPIYSLISKLFGIKIGIPVEVATGYVGYYVLGYFLNKINIETLHRRIIYLLATVAWIITVLGTYHLTSSNKGIFDGYFYEFLSLNVFVMSIAVYIFIKNINWNGKFVSELQILKLIGNLSTASFGIYLVHPMIIDLLEKIYISGLMTYPLIAIPLTTFIAIVISYFLVVQLKNIPIVKYLVP